MLLSNLNTECLELGVKRLLVARVIVSRRYLAVRGIRLGADLEVRMVDVRSWVA